MKVETAKQAISRDAPTTEGGTPEYRMFSAKNVYLSRPTKCYRNLFLIPTVNDPVPSQTGFQRVWSREGSLRPCPETWVPI